MPNLSEQQFNNLKEISAELSSVCTSEGGFPYWPYGLQVCFTLRTTIYLQGTAILEAARNPKLWVPTAVTKNVVFKFLTASSTTGSSLVAE